MVRQGRIAAFGLACATAAALALPGAALARVAYVTGTSGSNPAVAPADLATQTTGSAINIGGGEGPPADVAVTPDGKTAYVADGFQNVYPIDVATNTLGEPIKVITVQGCPRSLATNPAGTRVYVVDGCANTVEVIDTATNKLIATIPLLTGFANRIAVTPDGKRALVTDSSGEEVVPIDLTTNLPGLPITVGESPSGIVVAPDGSAAYVGVRLDEAVKRIDLATNAVGPAIVVNEFPDELAITPDGSRLYVLSGNRPVTRVDLATSTTKAIPIGAGTHYLEDVAIMPLGNRAWITDEEPNDSLDSIEIPADTVGPTFGTIDRPSNIAIVPDQPPRASFTVTPASSKPGNTFNFDATASVDTDGGSVARYDWDFGDGTTLPNGGPKPTHAFAQEGDYTVTLTLTDDEGCSLVIIFPGQTAFCNGSSIARTTRPVAVRVECPTAKGSATSFVPRFRSSHVVPGVRVRLAANHPAHLAVDATLEWTNGGHHRHAALDPRAVDVKHWRRIRYPIPGKLRDELPLGAPVTVKLVITATPLESSACKGSTTTSTIHVKVVKVIPGAEQHGRPK